MGSNTSFLVACWLGLSLGLVTGSCLGDETVTVRDHRCSVLEMFVRGDAERSQAAQKFIAETYSKRSGLRLVVRDVAKHDGDLDRFWKLADHFKVEKPGLPAFYVSGRFECGWEAESTPKRLEEALTVEVFVREGCPRCAAAHPVIFDQLAPRYPGYRFVEQDIANSVEARNRLQEVSQRYRVQAASVPALHFCGQLKVGFLDAATSFRQWDNVLQAVTVACPPEKTSSDRRSRSRGEIREINAGPAWIVAVLLAAQPAPALSTDEEPPAAKPAVTGTDAKPDAGSGADAPPPRRALPAEIPAEIDPLALPPVSTSSDAEFVSLPFLGDIRWREWGMPAFTIAVGLIDGFNPCAMWVLLFLLSLLVNLRDRWKILAVAGSFVVVSGLAYLAFMAAWLNVFQLIGWLRPAQLILGVLGIVIGSIHIKDFFAFKQGVSLSIPESAKPELYDRMRRILLAETLWSAILGATVLAVLVNVIELLCTAGLPAMYTNILTLQQYPVWKNYVYLLLYIAAYMFDDSLMVAIVVVTLGRHKLQERGGRILKLLSGLVIVGLGVVMIFKPSWLGALD